MPGGPCLQAGPTPAARCCSTRTGRAQEGFPLLAPSPCTQPQDESRAARYQGAFSASWNQPTSAPKESSELVVLHTPKLCKKYTSAAPFILLSLMAGEVKAEKCRNCIDELCGGWKKSTTTHKFNFPYCLSFQPPFRDDTGQFQIWLMSVTLLTARNCIPPDQKNRQSHQRKTRHKGLHLTCHWKPTYEIKRKLKVVKGHMVKCYGLPGLMYEINIQYMT